MPSFDRIEPAGPTAVEITMRPRFDVFRKLTDNRVQFLGSASSREEAERLAQLELSVGNPCFVLHSAFGVSSAVELSADVGAEARAAL